MVGGRGGRAGRTDGTGGFALEYSRADCMHVDDSGDIHLPSVPYLEVSDGERGVGDDGR